ncbi:MAG: TIGR02687 family protein [Alphaproteobacteria bacterium PA2]|nr:MAG: TIGR02687 family protein [Alphaproteobacteria bacterium PA2]
MDLSHIQVHLKRLFTSGGPDHAGHRVVWWHDAESEFDGEIDGLGLEACCDDGVEVIHLSGQSALALKVRILLEQPSSRFLLYQTGMQTDPANDLMLDIRRWAAPFAADKSTLILRELGLFDTLALKPFINERAKFFASRERLEKLQRLVIPGDTERQLDLKILAVLAKAAQPQLAHILRIALAEMDEEDLAAFTPLMAEFERFGLLDRFWDFVCAEFRYVDESPNLRNLLLRLFATDFARHVTGKTPEAFSHLTLPNGGGVNAVVFMDGWRDSSAYQRRYDSLAAQIAIEIKVKDQLSVFGLADLETVHSFLDVEKRIASLLTRQVLEASETVDAAKIAGLCGVRQDAYWANADKPTTHEAPRAAMHAVFEAITHAAAFLALKGAEGAHLRSNSAAETWAAYTSRLFRFDQLYRLFSEAADTADGENWDVLKDLRAHIEDVYGNWYLAELGDLWTRQVSGELLPGWSLPEVTNQFDFFRRAIKPILDGDPDRRVVVIISDAFRYEAAEELFRAMNGTDRYQAKLESMLGVLPSYTALGMAALLPHQQLTYTADAAVLLDGRPTAGLEARKKLLEAVGGVAVKAADLMEMKKDDGKAFFRPYRVIYVYHNQIDQTADTGNEDKTFAAVRTTIDEINALVRRAFTFNCNRAVVTADHGFLFQNTSPTEAQKNALSTRPSGTVIAKKRYLIGTNLGTASGAIAGSASTTAKSEMDMEFWAPMGINRFHFVGGSRFVHGGAMPQEICVPLLRINYARGEGKGRDQTSIRKVGIAPLFHSTRVTTARHRFTLTQTEAVSARVQPATARLAIYDGDQQISNTAVVTFDSAVADMNLWRKEVWLTLANLPFDAQKQYRLIIRDNDDQLDLIPPFPITISLAFDNDF